MKTVYTSVAAIMLATSAHAGNLVETGLADPQVLTPPAYSTGWGGLYGGLSFSNTEAEYERSLSGREMWREPIRDICYFDGGHSGGKKCTFPEGVAQKVFPDAPRCNRNYSETCFMSDNRVFIKGAVGTSFDYETGEYETVYGPEFTQYFTELVESGTVGGFLGYRHDVTPNTVAGFEVNATEDMLTGEIQWGLPMGNLLPYAAVGYGQYDGMAGATYSAGADLRVSERMFIGGKYTVGDFDGVDTETLSVRVGVSW